MDKFKQLQKRITESNLIYFLKDDLLDMISEIDKLESPKVKKVPAPKADDIKGILKACQLKIAKFELVWINSENTYGVISDPSITIIDDPLKPDKKIQAIEISFGTSKKEIVPLRDLSSMLHSYRTVSTD